MARSVSISKKPECVAFHSAGFRGSACLATVLANQQQSFVTKMTTRWIAAMALMMSAAVLPPAAAQVRDPGHWVTTWMAPPQPLWDSAFVLPIGIPDRFENRTLRQFVRISLGGARLRVVLSNEHGTEPLEVAAAGVAVATAERANDPETDRELRFAGQRAVTVAPGARAVSDPVELPVADRARLAVSVFLPSAAPAGFHFDARDTMLSIAGDAVHRARWDGPVQTMSTRAFVTAVAVERQQPAAALVALGDSITDGNGSTPSADRRWPDALADRLATRGVAVLNAGISGNRLLRDGMGQSGLARAARDVFSQSEVRTLVVLLGTNDIGWPGGPFASKEPPMTPAVLIAGFRQLIAQAKTQRVRIIGGTLPPFEGALKGTPLEGHYSPAKEATRQAVNRWIRESREFDAVADFDRLLRDPLRPSRLAARYDSGDHLHPNDAGYRAMAEMLDHPAALGL
jgi:lysophospholipase L1-like esterase